eukprot:3298188-Rhodomonas_salina.3
MWMRASPKAVAAVLLMSLYPSGQSNTLKISDVLLLLQSPSIFFQAFVSRPVQDWFSNRSAQVRSSQAAATR